MKRGAASTFDFTAIGLLALAPWLLKQVQHLSIIAAPSALISDESLLIFGMFLAMTPIPLIYWRIFFHKLMRSPTPGEFLAGVATITKEGWRGFEDEAIYGLAQYFLLFGSGMPLLLFVLVCSCTGRLDYGIIKMATYVLLPVFIWSLLLMSLVYWPRSKSNYQSFIDDQCKISVDRLR